MRVKERFSACLRAYVAALRRRDLAVLLFTAIAAGWLLTLPFILFGGPNYFYDLFFDHATDTFMDFLNSARDASLFDGVYIERGVIYPPLANLIFLVFARLMPADYAATEFEERLQWPHYPGVIAINLIYLALTAAALVFLYRRMFAGRGRWLMVLGCVAAVCNISTVYGMERGNIVVLSTAAAAYFCLTFDAESKKLREAGLIALAFAIALKLYPAVFAWMLLTEKRYREIARLLLYTAVLFLAPSFLFGGPVCFLWMAVNALVFFAWHSGVSSPHLWDVILNSAVSVLFWVSVAGAPFVPYLFKKRWQVFAYFSVVLAAALPLQSVYGCMILWAPMWMGIFEEKTLTLKNARYFVPMGLLFVPLVNPWYGIKGLNQVLLPLWMLILLCVYLADLVIAALRFWREKRNPAPVNGPEAPEGEENNDTKTKGEDHE